MVSSPTIVPIPEELRLLTVGDLAAILGLKRQTVYNRLCGCPETLPAITRIPTIRGPRWTIAAVREWQARFDPANLDLSSGTRGRPTKREEIARRARLIQVQGKD